ncbi:MAG: Lipopolysaccharide export system permease protein LptG [Legionellaceae bacterium]
MNLLTRYIANTIFHTLVIVLTVLAGLEAFILMISQLREIGTGHYTLFQALIYVLLTLPSKIYSFLPMAGLIGVLMGLGTLVNHSELIVMRAVGLSLKQIIISLLKSALIFILIMTLLGETIAPYLQRHAERHKTFALSKGQTLQTGQGIWSKDGSAFYHIQAIVNPRHLLGISRYLFNDHYQLIMVSYAKNAIYKNKQWIFNDVIQTHITEKKVFAEKINTLSLPLALKPNLLKVADLEPANMSIFQLFQTIRYHSRNGLHVSSYSLAFWQRLCQPMASLIMMLLALPFIFGPLRAANRGLRLLAGISISFGFYILNQFFGPVSLVMQLPPFLAAVLPSILFGMLGLFLMKRAR